MNTVKSLATAVLLIAAVCSSTSAIMAAEVYGPPIPDAINFYDKVCRPMYADEDFEKRVWNSAHMEREYNRTEKQNLLAGAIFACAWMAGERKANEKTRRSEAARAAGAQ